MKKLTAAILACMMLVSCGSTISEEQIIENLEAYDIAQGEQSPETLTAVSEYSVITGVEGIISGDWVINDGKYYFVTQTVPEGKQNSIKMIRYIKLETGTSNLICPDPLCSHRKGSGCRYTDLSEMHFTEPGVFYTQRIKKPDGVMEICKVDLNHDIVEEVHVCSSFAVKLIGINDNKLYYYELVSKTQEKRTVNEYYLYSIDTASYKVESYGALPEKIASELGIILGIIEGELYYETRDRLMKTDLNFENITPLMDTKGMHMKQLFFDTHTDEIFYSLIDEKEFVGGIYVYRNGISERVILPDENIYAFTLTRDKIYYSPYNPVYYGISAQAYFFNEDPENCRIYDYSGGKVFCVNRIDMAEAELAYDCEGEYILCDGGMNYAVIDGNLYFEEGEVIRQVIDGTEYTDFSSAHTVNRIVVNLDTKEVRRISLE